jgi:RimJ/RimL family protein N-acetyltransferase
MSHSVEHHYYRGTGLELTWFLVPWDTAIFGYPVAQIDTLDLFDESHETDKLSSFFAWCQAHEIKLVSCRLPHEKLRESIYLESKGFRFIEMVLHPVMTNLKEFKFEGNNLSLERANSADIPMIRNIAGRAFHNERYHVDPRLNRSLADLRYQVWVDNAVKNSQQEILVLREGKTVIGFFIWERQDSNAAYWHLTAINPDYQGQGYGRKAWQSILNYHYSQGVSQVKTTISARNFAVLNLYASLGFRFEPPEMTFHLLRNH